MRHYNILVAYDKVEECGEVISSQRIGKAFTDSQLFKVPFGTEDFTISYVCLNDSQQEAEREAIEYIEELEHQKVQSLTEYMQDRLQYEAEDYYQD